MDRKILILVAPLWAAACDRPIDDAAPIPAGEVVEVPTSDSAGRRIPQAAPINLSTINIDTLNVDTLNATASIDPTNSCTCPRVTECHVCDPSDCSVSNVADGTACSDDSNACTSDVCSAGACTHSALTGKACDDGKPCTYADKCSASGVCGGSAITCTSDTCNTRTCNGTSTCAVVINTGTACDDSSRCTSNDACTNTGICTGTGKTCTASDQCHLVGTCDPMTGSCTNPTKTDGSACDDKNACTKTDTCQAGACVGSNPVVCAVTDPCKPGACDAVLGMCSANMPADGTPCDDGDGCTVLDSCKSGVCAGGMPKSCDPMDLCHLVGTCNPGNGLCTNPAKIDGVSCLADNGGPGVCTAGHCAPSDPDAAAGTGGAGPAPAEDGAAPIVGATPEGGSSAMPDGSDGEQTVDLNSGCGCRLGARSSRANASIFVALLGLASVLRSRRRKQ